MNSFQTLIAAVINVWASQYTIQDKRNIRYLPNSGLSLLHISACYDSIKCFKYLHEEKDFSLRHPSQNNLFAIYYACHAGSTNVVKYILSQDPSQSQLNFLGLDNKSLLNIAIFGNKEIIEELLKNGANVTDPWNDQYQIIIDAIATRKMDILSLIYKLITPNIQPPPNHPSFIVKAIIDFNLSAVEFFIAEDGIDFTQANNAQLIEKIIDVDNRTLRFKNTLINILSKDTENIPLDQPNQSHTACGLMCKYFDSDVAKLIVRTRDFDINRFDERHLTGACWLINKRDHSKVCDMIKFLIENGFDVNNRYDVNSPTILESFILGVIKNHDAIKLLIEYGADINALGSAQLTKKGSITLLQYVNESMKHNQRISKLH